MLPWESQQPVYEETSKKKQRCHKNNRRRHTGRLHLHDARAPHGRPPQELECLIQQINRQDRQKEKICCLVGAGLSGSAFRRMTYQVYEASVKKALSQKIASVLPTSVQAIRFGGTKSVKSEPSLQDKTQETQASTPEDEKTDQQRAGDECAESVVVAESRDDQINIFLI
jgi:hypothetical protein